MHLEDLSLDGLQQVFGLLEPWDIGNLWLCGSVRLMWLLSDSQTLLKFEYEFNPRFPLRFPHLVGSLSSLHHLSIKYDMDKSIVLDFAPKMPSLPRNLRYLELEQSFAIVDFNAQMEDPSRFDMLHTLILRQNTDYENYQDVCCVDLRPLSNLRILKIFEAPSFGSPPREFLLPPDLVDITIPQWIATGEWASSLPTSLTRLEVHGSSATPFFEKLPRGLVELKVLIYPALLNQQEFRALPRGLTSLHLSAISSISASMIAQLPVTLEDLSLFQVASIKDAELIELWPSLPPALKKMSRWFWPSQVSQSVAKALPRTLCQSIPCYVSSDAISFLPKGTKAFKVASWDSLPFSSELVYPLHLQSLTQVIISEKQLAILPPTLTHLETFLTKQALTKEMVLILPKKLRYLRILLPNQNKSSESWIALPRTIETLLLEDTRFDDSLKEPKIGKKHAKTLPPFLRELRLQYVIVEPDFYFELPRTLVSICLRLQDLPLTSYQAFSDFPNLLTISIVTEQIPDHWIPILSAMPKTTRYFTWTTHGQQTTDLIQSDFSILPRGLLTLTIPDTPNVTSFEEFKLLPPFIESIKFGSNGSFFF